jgi:hypothetical protein
MKPRHVLAFAVRVNLTRVVIPPQNGRMHGKSVDSDLFQKGAQPENQ